MAVSPLHPVAAPALSPTAAIPVAPVDAGPVATPAAASADSAGTHDSTSQQRQQPGTTRPSLEKALEEINSQMQAWSTQLQFKMDPDVHRLVVTVIDSETGDTLRTIPSEAVLKIAKMIMKFQGNAVETKA